MKERTGPHKVGSRSPGHDHPGQFSLELHAAARERSADLIVVWPAGRSGAARPHPRLDDDVAGTAPCLDPLCSCQQDSRLFVPCSAIVLCISSIPPSPLVLWRSFVIVCLFRFLCSSCCWSLFVCVSLHWWMFAVSSHFWIDQGERCHCGIGQPGKERL